MVANVCVEYGPEISDGRATWYYCPDKECYAAGVCDLRWRLVTEQDSNG